MTTVRSARNRASHRNFVPAKKIVPAYQKHVDRIAGARPLTPRQRANAAAASRARVQRLTGSNAAAAKAAKAAAKAANIRSLLNKRLVAPRSYIAQFQNMLFKGNSARFRAGTNAAFAHRLHVQQYPHYYPKDSNKYLRHDLYKK